jgi:hypothetical protein
MSTPDLPPVPPSSFAQPAPVEPEVARMSQLSRVCNIFFEPSRVFADIRRKASWWLPWLLVSVMSLVFVVALQQRIGFEKVTQSSIAHNAKQAERFDKLTPDQKAQQMRLATAITKGICYGMPAMVLLGIVINAALLLAIYNFILGAELKFSNTMAVSAWSSLPGLISTPLAIVTMYLSDPDGYDVKHPLASNLGAFFDPQAHPFLSTFLGGFDLFTLWTILLIAIGFTQYSKVKRSTGFWTIFGLFLVWKLMQGGFALL